jgi:hypothetical protein
MVEEPAGLVEALRQLRARTLFYPSAGQDTVDPVEHFAPWVNEFWFVDRAYRCDSSKRFPGRLPSGFRLTDSARSVVTGRTIENDEAFEIVMRTDTLEFKRGGSITVRWCAGRGYDLFRMAFLVPAKPLSIFFHRGDSPGDGGSNFYWLGRKRLRNVLQTLEPRGLIVSDGSIAVRGFSKFHREEGVGPAAATRAEPFVAAGRLLTCLGYLGERYGPTLVWQVS